MRNFENLVGVKINHTHWPTHEEMRHRSVGIKLRYTSMPMNEIKKVINATMKGSCALPSTKMIIYSNMRDKIVQLGKKVEEYLDTDSETFLIDVIILHGHLTRTQKASYLDLFVSNTITHDHDVWILCCDTSGVANVGIDSKDVYCACNVHIPNIRCMEKHLDFLIHNINTFYITFILLMHASISSILTSQTRFLHVQHHSRHNSSVRCIHHRLFFSSSAALQIYEIDEYVIPLILISSYLLQSHL